EPTLESGEPLLRELIRVPTNGGEFALVLNPTSFIFGQVSGPSGALIPETLLSFFSRDLGSEGQSIFIGSARVGEDGEFALPLPSPNRLDP
ncbi:MAG: hypothetical protein AAFQ82_15690, partial [Myxococcota bacterium]